MARPFTYYNQLRVIDQSVYDWLAGLVVDYGTVEGVPKPSMGILRVFASPQRAFAEMEKVLVRKGWLPTPLLVTTAAIATPIVAGAVYKKGDYQYRFRTSLSTTSHTFWALDKAPASTGTWTKFSGSGPATLTVSASALQTPEEATYDREGAYLTVPLPFASISRADPTSDIPRAMTLTGVSQLDPTFEGSGKFLQQRLPTSWEIPYTVEFWSQKVFTDAYIREWIMGQVAHYGASPNEFFIESFQGEFWGTKLLPFRVESISDNSDVEGITTTQRMLRTTLSFTAKAKVYLPAGPEIPAVLSVYQDYVEPVSGYQASGTLESVVTIGNLIRKGQIWERATIPAAIALNDSDVLLHPEGRTKPAPDEGCFRLDFASAAEMSTPVLPAKRGICLIRGDLYLEQGATPLVITATSRADALLTRLSVGTGRQGWYRFSRFVKVPVDATRSPDGISIGISKASGYAILLGLGVYQQPLGASVWTAESTGLEITLQPSESTQITLELGSDQFGLFSCTVATDAALLFSSYAGASLVDSLSLAPDETTACLLLAAPYSGSQNTVEITNSGSSAAHVALTELAAKLYSGYPGANFLPSNWPRG